MEGLGRGQKHYENDGTNDSFRCVCVVVFCIFLLLFLPALDVPTLNATRPSGHCSHSFSHVPKASLYFPLTHLVQKPTESPCLLPSVPIPPPQFSRIDPAGHALQTLQSSVPDLPVRGLYLPASHSIHSDLPF